MTRYQNKRLHFRNRGKFTKATFQNSGLSTCPVCRHIMMRVYDGPETQHPDPRNFRFRCFTCEPAEQQEPVNTFSLKEFLGRQTV